jgi:DNA polymerase III subunit delta'
MMEIVGHDAQMQSFKAAIDSGKLHHGWLFAGPKGVGKASFAKAAASLLIDPENLHHNLIDQRSHPDMIWIERLPKDPPKEGETVDPDAEKKRSITVDQIRELQRRLTTRPSMASKRAIIIDAADDLERGGANALLKSLEEPPMDTYFLLISHASDRLLPTIRSRCRMLRFSGLSDTEMRRVLHQVEDGLSESDLGVILPVCNGAPGQALNILGLDMADLETKMNRLITGGDTDNHIRHQLAETLSAKSAQQRYEAFLRRAPSRICEHARTLAASETESAVEAFHAADALASRAIALSLDKQAVVFEMGSLLAGLQTHKQAAN